MKMSKAVIDAYAYARWSSNPQEKGDSPVRQHERAAEYAKKRHYNLIELPPDAGISAYHGANLDGELGLFLKKVRNLEIKKGSVLLVESVDRLSRQQPILAFGLVAQILAADIIIETYGNGRQYTKHDELELFTLLADITRAHSESATKGDRVRAAWQRKRAKATNLEAMTARVPGWIISEGGKSKSDKRSLPLDPLELF